MCLFIWILIRQYWQTSSDALLEKNITPIKNALDKVTALQGVKYGLSTKENPEENLSKAVEYGNIVSALVEAIKGPAGSN